MWYYRGACVAPSWNRQWLVQEVSRRPGMWGCCHGWGAGLRLVSSSLELCLWHRLCCCTQADVVPELWWWRCLWQNAWVHYPWMLSELRRRVVNSDRGAALAVATTTSSMSSSSSLQGSWEQELSVRAPSRGWRGVAGPWSAWHLPAASVPLQVSL